MLVNRRTLIAGAIAAPLMSLARSTSAQETGWTLLDDSGTGPVARWDHSLMADDARDRLLVFGGRDASGTALGDLWTYDLAGQGWTASNAAGPAPRFGSAVAVSADGSGAYLFGGQSAEFFNDLWWLDFESGAWTLLDDGSGVAPTPRYGLGGALDDNGRFIVSHGFTFEGRFDDTWAFDPATGAWEDISPAPEQRPLRRCLHEVVKSPASNRIVLYAGCSSGYGPCPQGDTWEFDPENVRWTDLTPALSPPPRSNPAMATDGDAFLLVGGLTESGPASDVWTGVYDGSAFVWTADSSASGVIPPRSSHDLATIGGDHYVFGGSGVDGPMADLWRYTPGA